mmetsp:Transcript_18295/g.54946  ORF Transcript_18295/g.54946 Transcript_18295/m.54946 type:complete len:289 (+) Transcript_18295:955-1821(+)
MHRASSCGQHTRTNSRKRRRAPATFSWPSVWPRRSAAAVLPRSFSSSDRRNWSASAPPSLRVGLLPRNRVGAFAANSGRMSSPPKSDSCAWVWLARRPPRSRRDAFTATGRRSNMCAWCSSHCSSSKRGRSPHGARSPRQWPPRCCAAIRAPTQMNSSSRWTRMTRAAPERTPTQRRWPSASPRKSAHDASVKTPRSVHRSAPSESAASSWPPDSASKSEAGVWPSSVTTRTPRGKSVRAVSHSLSRPAPRSSCDVSLSRSRRSVALSDRARNRLQRFVAPPMLSSSG